MYDVILSVHVSVEVRRTNIIKRGHQPEIDKRIYGVREELHEEN